MSEENLDLFGLFREIGTPKLLDILQTLVYSNRPTSWLSLEEVRRQIERRHGRRRRRTDVKVGLNALLAKGMVQHDSFHDSWAIDENTCRAFQLLDAVAVNLRFQPAKTTA